MIGGSQVHIFWGAPVLPLKMTVSQEPASLVPTADCWKTVQLLHNKHSLHLKDEKCKHQNLGDYQILDSIVPPGLNSHCFVNTRERSVHLENDFLCCVSETQNIVSQKSPPSRMNDVLDSSVQVDGFKSRVQHLTEEEKYQKLASENKKITVEQHKDQSNTHAPNFKEATLQLDQKSDAILDLVCITKEINIGPEAAEPPCVLRTYHEVQNQCLQFSPSKTVDKPRSKGAVTNVSNCKISTDTEFLSIMTSSQVALLAQRKYKGQNSLSKGAGNMTIGPNLSHEKIGVTKDNLIQPLDDFAEDCISGQSQAYSPELFSPVCPKTKSSHVFINSDADLKDKIGSQELFSTEENQLPNEICIESYSSGILYSQHSTLHKSSIKRSWTSEDKAGHSKVLPKVLQVSKKMKLLSNARDLAVTLDQRNMSEFKYVKKTSLIKNCGSKSQKYNCLVMVLSPCHVKEVSIKSGPNAGSKVPLAAITVTDQSEMKKKVLMWRTTAFWALTVLPGDIILLTDVMIHEDQWVGETVLQSTFTTQLLNLGTYSCVQPEEYSSIVSAAVLKELLAFVSSHHSCFGDLPQRHPRELNIIKFVELEHLQPEMLVHALFKVVDITILTEALYNYRGQKQRKVMVTVEQTQGQHHVLVLWGPGAAWYPQLQKKKGMVLIKAQILELVFPVRAAQKRQITLNAQSTLKNIFDSLPNIIYSGCAKCGLELEIDENKIYKQCFSCLPFAMKKIYYRPALMTVVDGPHNIFIQVQSEVIEKILLNISPDWLDKVIVPSSGITYRMVAADLLHALLAPSGTPCLLKIQSLFVLDENSYPLQQDFYLLDFYPDGIKHHPTP
ncbi:PREDICTED: protein FAM35A-like [Chrysochloris asiatica]|uniref:Protein FAM35A-like n=1 Tax=Chrysochloris asiatica TaxID=185453 RepID=A0A9B0X2C7_CHRAS|nr:PREDICTED: protein FAM35A-like [Chrysochloris asiatica]